MSDHTVHDFLVNPNVLADEELLTDEQLDLIGDLSVNVDEDMSLSHLVEIVQVATGHGLPGAP